jgi:hypothetical protein
MESQRAASTGRDDSVAVAHSISAPRQRPNVINIPLRKKHPKTANNTQKITAPYVPLNTIATKMSKLSSECLRHVARLLFERS